MSKTKYHILKDPLHCGRFIIKPDCLDDVVAHFGKCDFHLRGCNSGKCNKTGDDIIEIVALYGNAYIGAYPDARLPFRVAYWQITKIGDVVTAGFSKQDVCEALESLVCCSCASDPLANLSAEISTSTSVAGDNTFLVGKVDKSIVVIGVFVNGRLLSNSNYTVTDTEDGKKEVSLTTPLDVGDEISIQHLTY